jgi:thiol:disulfide interchange protein DsbC
MFFKHVLLGLTLVCTSFFGTVSIAQGAPSAPSPSSAATEAKLQAVKKLFSQRFDNPSITAVRLTPYGLYEIQLGPELVYTDENVTFVFDGTLIDAKTRQDYTRERMDAIARVPFDQLPVELAMKQVKGDGSRKLAIFEDPNCGYCKVLRKALGDIDNLTVYTYPFPILSPDSTQKVRNVWCASDRAATWDAWMLKGKVPPKIDCEVPIDQMIALGKKLMVRGTPAIFFEDGSRVGGAIPKNEIEKRLKASTTVK